MARKKEEPKSVRAEELRGQTDGSHATSPKMNRDAQRERFRKFSSYSATRLARYTVQPLAASVNLGG